MRREQPAGGGKALNHYQSVCVFVSVATHRSFSRAAQELDISTAAASRSVTRLERHLGQCLLTRSTRRIDVTEAGATFLEGALRVTQSLERLEQEVRQLSLHAAGVVRVQLPDSLLIHRVMPRLAGFHARYPDIELELNAHGGTDPDVRVTFNRTLPEPFIAHALGHVELVMCATPRYLQLRGVPRHADDLARHDVILHSPGEPCTALDEPWFDDRLIRNARSWIRCRSAQSARAAALCHLGIALLPSYCAHEATGFAELARVLPGMQPSLPVHVLVPGHHRKTRKVQVVCDWLREQCRLDAPSAPPFWVRASAPSPDCAAA